MSELIVKHAKAPDERRPFVAHGHLDVFDFGGGSMAGFGIFEPGWKWSRDVKPIAGTESCQSSHLGYVISGRLAVVMDDGTKAEVGPGDMVVIPPGHDAWVIGDEPCTMVDFGGAARYAQRGEEDTRYASTSEEVAPGIH
ncbi:cupin domain-containing protein [Pyxidicoccus parkwayensis]|uniref:Cupin domain-containing protein n=1 Tax=Pyxidicoccus parkwayensis TaxID=2813578 RepID=A0ABX7PAH9_9BACT|nr:cupin domain-containing protein [Pyxidicoccus parkwaysis]QSQ27518.1 cupin domain-containing protein [Pyxidicoccus parkwaysis]